MNFYALVSVAKFEFLYRESINKEVFKLEKKLFLLTLGASLRLICVPLDKDATPEAKVRLTKFSLKKFA